MPDIGDLLERPANAEGVVRDLLHRVIDPEVGVNIVDLGLVRGIAIDESGNVLVTLTLTSPACPLGPYMVQSIADAMDDASWIASTDVTIVWEPPWNPQTDMTATAKHQLGWPA